MKKFLLLCVFFGLHQLSFGQYVEDFAGQALKGIRGACTDPFNPESCATVDLTDIDWTIGGTDLTQLTNSGDYFAVNNAENIEARDVDNLVCWISPELDISAAVPPIQVDVDYRVQNFDLTDQFQILYSLDGGIPQVGQTLLVVGDNISQQGVLSATGIPGGNSLFISVCVNVNENNERVRFDNITVPNDFVNILPIELYQFDAKRVDDRVHLSWITISELNNDYMAVERSQNGIDFYEIGRVDGSGTISFEQAYDFIDESPRPGLNYYRLRQVDFDGSVEYHRVVVVDMEGQVDQKIQILPNPANEIAELQLGQSFDEQTEIFIYNTNGQLIAQQKLQAGTTNLELDLSNLASGMYQLKWVHQNEVELIPFVKQ